MLKNTRPPCAVDEAAREPVAAAVFPAFFITPFDAEIGAFVSFAPKMAPELELRPLGRRLVEVVDDRYEVEPVLDTRRGRELMDVRVSRRYRGLPDTSSGIKSSSSLTVDGDVDASSSSTSILFGAEKEWKRLLSCTNGASAALGPLRLNSGSL